jgi:outer membrane receptor for ferrienterochelin and colicins
MKNYLLAFCLLLMGGSSTFAQVRGTVYGSDTNATNEVYGARIELIRSGIKVLTDTHGKFEFTLPKETPDTMVITARGFYPDTMILQKEDRFSNLKIVLYSQLLLPEVAASYKKGSKSILKLRTLLVEEIGEGELRKAACCNLSESFETNASVDVSFTDAVSGAKQIQMMGLNGVYTQMQLENIPYLRGLESAFGLNSLPGTWINSIQITKGTGPAVNGYESMAGLINLEIKKPHDMERFYLNAYGNSIGRAELNLHGAVALSPKWSAALFAHGSSQTAIVDQNRDGFRDVPTGTNTAFLNRWHYQGDRMEAQLGLSVYQEDKVGGELELGFDPSTEKASQYYGVRTKNDNVNVFAKTGFFFKDAPYRSVGILYNFKYHETNGFYGYRGYAGREKRGFINVIYDDIIGSTIHKTRFGLSATVVDFQQSQDSLIDNRTEMVPGVFGEYTYTGIRLVNVLGARFDYHNLFGPMFSPRLHSKYTISENTDFRFTAGRGWRVPNYIVDNLSLLATGRKWIAPKKVEVEVSWNVGGSVVQEWKLFGRKSALVLDYYYTFFENQLLVDRDAAQDAIIFRYSDGVSFSHSFQSEYSFSPIRNVDVRLAYKYLEVKAEYNGALQNKVMVPKHRGFMNIAYKTRNKRWEYDFTTSVFGKSRLPLTILASGELTTQNESEVFPLVSAQITHIYHRWDFYLGAENLANIRMENPILDSTNPFGSTFDATRVWSPVMGTIVYIGIRFSIDKKED